MVSPLQYEAAMRDYQACSLHACKEPVPLSANPVLLNSTNHHSGQYIPLVRGAMLEYKIYAVERSKLVLLLLDRYGSQA